MSMHPVLCPNCGHDRFEVGNTITIWQTRQIRFTDTEGNFEEEDDELGDTIEVGDPETLECCQCREPMDLNILNGDPHATTTD